MELAEPLTLPPPDEREQQFQELWRQFYKTLEIRARHNEKGRMTHCPKRFWADLTEMQGEQKTPVASTNQSVNFWLRGQFGGFCGASDP